MISFQPVSDIDIPLIKEIYDYYILNSTSTFHCEPISINEIKEFLYINHPKYASYLIKDSGNVIGYCFLSKFKNRKAYDRTAEVSLYIKPESVGKGTGTIAMEYIENVAKERGIHVLIGTLSGDNLASMKLSEKMGFLKVAHLKKCGREIRENIGCGDISKRNLNYLFVINSFTQIRSSC